MEFKPVFVSYPFEVAHVGGLNRSADERQVVDFCRLLVSLVRLHEQLPPKEKSVNGTKSGLLTNTRRETETPINFRDSVKTQKQLEEMF